jgi:hypothetical protein
MPDEPPPKGAPQPRLGYLPPPAPARASETIDENERRFPILENQQRREREKRASLQQVSGVEVRTDKPQACDGLPAEEKIECPLRDAGAVVSVVDLPRGVRVSLRPGPRTPEKLQQLLACHQSLATARPQTPGPCGFIDARTEAEVNVREGRIDVDLERGSDVARLRQQVRAALSPRR